MSFGAIVTTPVPNSSTISDDGITTLDVIFHAKEKELRAQRLDLLSAEKSTLAKGKPLVNVHAASIDGKFNQSYFIILH